MRRPGTAVAVVVAASSMLGCDISLGRTEAPLAGGSGGGTAAIAPELPDVLDVVCSPTGTRVSATVVAARADGVHVRVRQTSGASGIYLNFSYDSGPDHRGGGGGDGGVGTIGAVRVLTIPPGAARLNCSSDVGRKEDEPVVIEVRDPARAWRSGAQAALGCPEQRDVMVIHEWVFGPGTGPTADAALKDLITETKHPATWHAAQEGYVAAAQQHYVLRRDGNAWATAYVNRDGTRTYTASLDRLCHPDVPSVRPGQGVVS